MKPCLKLSNSSTQLLCTHRKCVAFGPQVAEEVHIADEWDRTPTEPTRRLSYQDLLELKEIQRSLPHANQPYDPNHGRHYLSQVPIALVPLLPNQPAQCKFMLPLPDTPPSSGTSSPYSSSSSRTSSPPPSLLCSSTTPTDLSHDSSLNDPPTPSLTHTSLDSSPHSSPDPNPFLPLLSDDPDPHPHTSVFPMRSIGRPCRRKQKKKKFIIVNDIEIELEDSDSDDDTSDSHHDSDSELDHLDLDEFAHPPRQLFDPDRSATPTPPPTPTQDEELDLHIPNSALFSQLSMSRPPAKSCDSPTLSGQPSLFDPELHSHSITSYPPSPSHLPAWRESSSPLAPPTPVPATPKLAPASINLHIPVMFKRSRSGSCLGRAATTGTPTSTLVNGV